MLISKQVVLKAPCFPCRDDDGDNALFFKIPHSTMYVVGSNVHEIVERLTSMIESIEALSPKLKTSLPELKITITIEGPLE